ncbi:hypothetical protein BDZ94DRAFT_1234602 [Collybia nuda]|uniref:Secreted protein n=1 Tax=Collybia nuda TaxID=64659 RepID=A0A9P6CM78_9AGAR|nr:hypothetical protein BDZ94DRAFT_1234602 [Collybia nuda]
MIASRIALSLLFLAAPLTVLGQTGPGSCHPYPGATAADCLELIATNLNDSTELACDSKTGRATLNYRTCSIVTKCASGQTAVEIDAMARRSLATIGACAFNDRGSISGSYVAEDGSKTCYLFTTRESACT